MGMISLLEFYGRLIFTKIYSRSFIGQVVLMNGSCNSALTKFILNLNLTFLIPTTEFNRFCREKTSVTHYMILWCKLGTLGP